MDDQPSENWQILDEEKYYDVNGHLIYIISSKKAEDIIPTGYRHLSSESLTKRPNKIKRHFFVNEVPVIANLCYNEENDELCFYYPGRIVLEKAKCLIKSK